MKPTVPDPALASLLAHAGFVRALALAIVRDPARADDVVQDTWMAALGQRSGPVRSPRAWLARVGRRLALRALRDEAHRRAREERAARPESEADPHARAGDADHSELLVEVGDAVLGLREPYRSTLLARFYEGRSPHRIASDLGLSVSTINSRLQRGLEELRRRLSRGRRPDELRASLLGLLGGALPLRQPAPPPASIQTGTGSAVPFSGVFAMGLKLKLTLFAAGLVIGALVLVRSLAPQTAAEPVAGGGLEPPTRLLTPTREGEEGPARPAAETSARSPAGRAPTAERAAPPTTGALDLRVVRERDGSPAAGRGVQLFPWDGSEPFLSGGTHVADADGRIRVDGLAPGVLMLYVDVGGGGQVRIVAGETTTADLRIPTGFRVEGRVVDLEGRGIPGASVWLSDYGNPNEGTWIETADGRGSFVLEDVGPSRKLAARAAGFAASAQRAVVGRAGEVVALELRLQAGAAQVHGRVLGADGRGVEGARVRLTSPRRSEERQAGLDARTDGEGLFDIEGVPPGEVRLAVRAPGEAPFEESLSVDSGERRRCDVQLVAAGHVYGVVRDGEGRPVAGASLREGEYGGFLASFTRSDAQGRYRLENLPTGAVHLEVRSDAGAVQRTLDLQAGVPEAWDPVVDPGRVVSGHVVDGAGLPLQDLEIEIIASKPRSGTKQLWSEYRTTDAAGGFSVAGAPEGELSLEVSTAHPEKSVLLHRTLGPDEGEGLLLRLGADRRPSASIEGELADAGGTPLGAEVLLFGPHRTFRRAIAPQGTGAFRFGGLVPGEYRLHAKAEGFARVSVATVVEAEEERRLGRWTLPFPAHLRLRVDGVPGPGPFGQFRLFAEGEPTLEVPAAEIEALPLAPGSYRLVALGAGDESAALCEAEFEAGPGEEVWVDLEDRPGVSVGLVWPSPAEEAAWRTVLLRDAGEALLFSESGFRPWKAQHETRVRLLPGEYSVLARVRGAERVTRFRVVAGSPAQRVDLEVPPQEDP